MTWKQEAILHCNHFNSYRSPFSRWIIDGAPALMRLQVLQDVVIGKVCSSWEEQIKPVHESRQGQTWSWTSRRGPFPWESSPSSPIPPMHWTCVAAAGSPFWAPDMSGKKFTQQTSPPRPTRQVPASQKPKSWKLIAGDPAKRKFQPRAREPVTLASSNVRLRTSKHCKHFRVQVSLPVVPQQITTGMTAVLRFPGQH